MLLHTTDYAIRAFPLQQLTATVVILCYILVECIFCRINVLTLLVFSNNFLYQIMGNWHDRKHLLIPNVKPISEKAITSVKEAS